MTYARGTLLQRLSIASLLVASLFACEGKDRSAGLIEGAARSRDDVAAHDQRQLDANALLLARSEIIRPTEAPQNSQILFGDLHVHSTYSIDAFTVELPMMAQQGVHTPADACDFARHCAKLDFYSHNDHAASLTLDHWNETKRVIRECNASADYGDHGGQSKNQGQDLVVFAGWEWTQVGTTAEEHWGHKNVIFPGIEENELPTRPINARQYDGGIGLFNNVRPALAGRWLDPLGWSDYKDLEWLVDEVAAVPECPKGVNTRDLPLDCHEPAPTPEVLFKKLDEWGFDYFVIPHGNAWGSYTPPTTTWDKQLNSAQHRPDKQSLIEVFSGHGNSEEYRSFRAWELDSAGNYQCPEPKDGYTACCWQAGEIMRQRCDGLDEEECERRVKLARERALSAGASYWNVFPDAQPEAWLNCGVCEDCFKPAFNYVPTESTQYAMALSNFDEVDERGKPLRFDWGFIGSTDDHTSRPGTGYKQYDRRKMTFASGVKNEFYGKLASMATTMDDPQMPAEVPMDYARPDGFRMQTFTYPGGIVAVHSQGRSREDIWDAMKRKETYTTSGPRMLLWFDMLTESGKRIPMGAKTEQGTAPKFEVRAVGAYKQKPGCPSDSMQALSEERLDYLCAGECYHPGDERHPITAIEVVRIRPQMVRDEPIDPLIEDAWKTFDCPADSSGCVIQFEDEDFSKDGRDTLYYVRALQEATPAINADHIRTEFDDDGKAVSVNLCHGDYRTDLNDDCLAPAQERAWSSPIFVDFAKSKIGSAMANQ